MDIPIMCRCAVTALLALVAADAHAAILVQQSSTPTMYVPDSRTWTVTLVSDNPDEIIYGVDARFEGPMGQVLAGGNSSPFLEWWPFIEIGGLSVTQDSAFLFQSTSLSPPALQVAESESLLTAAMTNLPSATGGTGHTVRLAQIAKLHSDTVRYSLAIDVRDLNGNSVRLQRLTGVIGIPEPATASLAGLAIAGVLGFRRRR